MLVKRGVVVDVDRLLALDEERLKLLQEVEKIRAEKNTLTQDDRERGVVLKEQLKEIEPRLKSLEEEVKSLHLTIPNLLSKDVPEGHSEENNVVIRQWGEIPKFGFEPQDHLALGQRLDLIDMERAGKVSGSRFGYLKNEAVLLEFALVQLALKTLISEGFVPIVSPVLIRKEITEGLGYWQAGEHNEYYLVTDPEEHPEGLYLVGTAEHAVVPLHAGEVLEGKSLPLRYAAFSSCFRREAGSYGKDTRGLIRVHQFDKLEMVSFARPEESREELLKFLSLEEQLIQFLKIPYQVVHMCAGDVGIPAAEKFDIEAWVPSQGKYREVTSTSTTTDYQARRMNIRFKDGDQKGFVHIQNGTGFAIGRTLVAIIENYQQEDGSVKVPEVLQGYVGKDVIEVSRS